MSFQIANITNTVIKIVRKIDTVAFPDIHTRICRNVFKYYSVKYIVGNLRE